jgi:hypothetical protein
MIGRWKLSRDESTDSDFSNLPDPTPQLLKLFAEFYIVTRKKVPGQKAVCNLFTSFTSRWERETSRTLSDDIKQDVLNVRGNNRSSLELVANKKNKSILELA